MNKIKTDGIEVKLINWAEIVYINGHDCSQVIYECIILSQHCIDSKIYAEFDFRIELVLGRLLPNCLLWTSLL